MEQNNIAILPENSPQRTRLHTVRWVAGLAAIPFLGVLTAFGVAPPSATEPPDLQRVVEEITLPAPELLDPGQDRYAREERIRRGDTLDILLSRLGAEDPAGAAFLRQSGRAALRQLVPGRTVRAEISGAGELLSLALPLGNGQVFAVQREEGRYRLREQSARTEGRTSMKSGVIESSLFAATDKAGVPDSVAQQLAEIFSSDVDFHKDLRRGDRFSVVYEATFAEGQPLGAGRVLAAEFVNQGRVYQAIYFRDGQGEGYYTPEGKSLRKAFLRSPLEFTRISSGFSSARFHPVLQTWRAHKGVDYAAPTGTRVRATADGAVAFAGRQGGYGNVVVLRHPNNTSTLYGHLSGFARGLRTGQRIRQGETVGYVGMSGLATGPHLHYEFRVNDVHLDPQRVAMPQAPSINARNRAAFEQLAQPMARRLTLLKSATNLALLE